MTEPSLEAPMKRRSGWRMLGLIVLGMVLLTIYGGFWWYYDDGDLDVVREQARHQGRPLNWSDLNLKITEVERLGTWKRIVELINGVTGFQTKLGPDGKVRYKVWDPIPDEMRSHHAAIDPVVITELASLLDRLGDQPLILHDKISYGRLLPEIGSARALTRFMQERLILADKAQAGIWGRRMLMLCRRYSVDSLMQHLICSDLLEITLNGITFRLEDLKQTDPTIAADILATLRPRYEDLLRALDGEFLMLLDAVARPGSHHVSALSDDWFMPLVTRAGRRGMLCAHLDTIQQLQLGGESGALIWSRAAEANFYAAKKGFSYPSLILQGFFMPAWSVIVSKGELVDLRGRVIAAELQGTPWPIDRFDPTGATLRPLHRDGRVIAAYSVHLDGMDQGGDAKLDRVIPLYADPSKP